MGDVTEVLEQLASEHDRIGSPARESLRAPRECAEVRRRLRDASLPAPGEYVELYGWHDGSGGSVRFFGDVSFCSLDDGISLSIEFREESAFEAETSGGPTWADGWIVFGGCEQTLLVLDASTSPAGVLYVRRHGEATNVTVADSLAGYVEARLRAFRDGLYEWRAERHDVVSEELEAAAALAGGGALPDWLLARAFPNRLELTAMAAPDNAERRLACTPRRRLRVDPSGEESSGRTNAMDGERGTVTNRWTEFLSASVTPFLRDRGFARREQRYTAERDGNTVFVRFQRRGEMFTCDLGVISAALLAAAEEFDPPEHFTYRLGPITTGYDRWWDLSEDRQALVGDFLPALDQGLQFILPMSSDEGIRDTLLEMATTRPPALIPMHARWLFALAEACGLPEWAQGLRVNVRGGTSVTLSGARLATDPRLPRDPGD